MKNIKRGFTLIELLVVIAIIGILSSVVLASLNSARAKSRDAKRLSDIKSLQLALELYFDQEKAYPIGLGVDYLVPDYIGQEPKDPFSDSYRYERCGGGDGYHLGASLEQDSSALKDDADKAWEAYCLGISDTTRDEKGCDNEDGRYCYDVTD